MAICDALGCYLETNVIFIVDLVLLIVGILDIEALVKSTIEALISHTTLILTVNSLLCLLVFHFVVDGRLLAGVLTSLCIFSILSILDFSK